MPATSAQEREAEIDCVPLSPVHHCTMRYNAPDPIDTAIRCLGRALKADEIACTRFMIPGYRQEAATALRRVDLNMHAARCERGCIETLYEELMMLWRAE